MMDPNILQHIPATAYVQKLDQVARSETPFADYDVLTPDEPILAWQLANRFLGVAGNFMTSHLFDKHEEVPQTGVQISVR